MVEERTRLYTWRQGSSEPPELDPYRFRAQRRNTDYGINLLTKRVSDIRLRIYVCPLINFMV